MRLRTACTFELKNTDIKSTNVNGFPLPSKEELIGKKNKSGKWDGPLPSLITKLAGDGHDGMRLTTVTFPA
jgi:hypothetical protein